MATMKMATIEMATMTMDTMPMDLVVLEGALELAPVAPSEDHVWRPAEYLGRGCHDYDHVHHDDHFDHYHDVDNDLEDLPRKAKGKSSTEQGVRLVEAQLTN